ncbi:MAG: enoyl-CoA hydratase/isomerase family protein [Hyphomonadaceae bacterium]
MTDRIGDVHITRDGFVATVMIDKPPINAVSVDLMRDLADALAGLDKDGVTRAVVLATAGKVFCSGADLSNRTSEGPIPERSINPLYDQAVRLFSTELPIVVAVQGAAIGAGLGLSLIGDFRVAAPEARFAANFTKLGFHPGFGLTYTLPRLIGRQNAAMMFLTGERYDASEALEMGLIDDLVDLPRLVGRAQTMAATIAENAPLAVRSTRKTLRGDLAAAVRAATDHEFSEQQWLMKTDDFKEGVKAVTERRAGDFKGR